MRYVQRIVKTIRKFSDVIGLFWFLIVIIVLGFSLIKILLDPFIRGLAALGIFLLLIIVATDPDYKK